MDFWILDNIWTQKKNIIRCYQSCSFLHRHFLGVPENSQPTSMQHRMFTCNKIHDLNNIGDHHFYMSIEVMIIGPR